MQIFRNALLAGVVVLLPAAAFAADLAPPSVEPVAPEIVPSFTWTGFYAGLSAGYGRGNLDTDLKAVPTTAGPTLERALNFGLNGGIAKVKGSANGVVAGGQIGYNYQIDANWVIGAEADLQYAGLDTKKTFIGAQDIPVTVKNELNWFGTARVRAGYAFDNVLIYGTGGLAYGQVKTKVSTGGTNLSGSETKFGWALGAGAEYALTQNWTLRAEYLYVDLGKAETIKASSQISQVTAKTDVSVHTVRAGVNYKF